MDRLEGLGRYLADTLPALFPSSAVRDLGRDDLYEIRLTQEARVEHGFWLQQRRLPGGGRLERETGPVTCRLARPAGPRGAQRGIEAVTQTHPLVRFVSERLAETDAPKLRPAIAARVASASLRPTTFVPPGRYAVLAMLWRFGGGVAQERIAYAGVAVPSGEIIPDDDAERLMLAAAEAGAMWPEAASELLTEDVAELCEGALLDRLAVRFATERSVLQAERQDRASIQLRTLEQRLEDDPLKQREIVDRNREALGLRTENEAKAKSQIAMAEGKIPTLEERASQRRAAIARSAELRAEEEQLALAVIEVLP